ncbi:MAG: serine/threonine protein kinase [bacterium]|nr:serine/threonine protein kinase [bacterium]
MSIDRHRRAKEVFLAACGLPGDERASYLDEECAGDDDLRREVEALLEIDCTTSDSADDRQPPERIGNFHLLQKVGEGGMGEVWEAEQEAPVRRRVAFKLIKWGMDTKEVLARFESERQALALMNHPNIAKAFEAGSTDEGRPFFAMEYVRGVPLTEYCDAQRLSTQERLTLFTAVCDGVQHAHQKGVIHRDIKPSNILVAVEDGHPAPKIIDFGVAKATSQRLTERTLFTELGQWIGTPEYMSPEQAELTGLDVDTRSDVYSLGVVLYELLAGVQPFDSKELRTAGFDEMRRRIREEEPPRPSTRVSSLGDASQVAAERRRTDIHGLTRTLRGDLDWIVMKALEKDQTRRYGSPSELAADVDRYLRKEAVEASPPSTAYRIRKFISRNRMGVAAGAAVIALLVAGVIGTTVGLLKARREADAARRSADVLESMFEIMDPARPKGGALTTRQVLDIGASRVNIELKNKPLVQARLLTILGEAYLNLGHFDEALPLVERSLAIREQELGADHPDVAATLNTLGWVQYWLGEFRSSRESFSRSLETRERTMAADDPEVAESLSDLAFLEWRSGDFDVADSLFERALEIIRRSRGSDGTAVADILYQRSLLQNTLGRYAEARDGLDRALEIRRDALGENHIDVGWIYHGLALANAGLGDREGSTELSERSLEIFENQLGRSHWSVAFPVTRLANAARFAGDRDTALSLFERGLAIRQSELPRKHPDQLYSLFPFGEYLLKIGEFDRAEKLFKEALRITEEALEPDHPERASSHAHLALLAWAREDYESAAAGFELALTICEMKVDPNHYIIAVNRLYLASSAARLGRVEYAIATLRDVHGARKLTLEGLDHFGFEQLQGHPDFERLVEKVRANPPT